MSRSQSELSLTQREILQLIIYRTKNPKHATFFGDNEYIAKCVNVKPDTIRKAIKELIKLEYLVQGKDKQGRRHLVYTGKAFAPIIADMRNFDKSILKQERDNYLRDLTYCQNELGLAQIRIKTLDKDNSDLRLNLLHTETRLIQLENLFTAQGVTKEQIDVMIKQAVET
ncbi:MAG: helix-turn-helix domain-containing protein [Muribaculaceae bacterium]|nr:helix-turn-helix domain-containing protein [Muribaculaceae bacterium]